MVIDDPDDETTETYICPYCMSALDLDGIGDYCPVCDEEVVLE